MRSDAELLDELRSIGEKELAELSEAEKATILAFMRLHDGFRRRYIREALNFAKYISRAPRQ